MNDICKDIKDFLESESALGLEFGKNLFIGRLPTKPDQCVVLYPNPSIPPDMTLGMASIWGDSFQMYVRDTSFEQGMEFSYLIRDSLHAQSNFTVNETFYLFIKTTGNPFLLEWDDNNRVILNINFETKRRI